MEDSNSLDLTDNVEDRVHVPFAFTRDHAEWLTADGQANFARGTEASVTQSQEDAYAAMAMKDTLSSPFGLDSARPTLGLSDVRAQPTKKDDGCATLETEGDLPDTTAIIQTLMSHRDLIMNNQMIYLIVDNRMPAAVPYWPAFAAWWASRRCLVGPQEEATDVLWVCADATTGLHKVPYYWAGVFVLEAARFLYPAQHFALIDNDCVPVTLFEVQDLLQLAHQQHQWVDLIGRARSESSSCAGIGTLLFTEAHLEYNAGLVISIGNRSKHSPLEQDSNASTLAKNLQAGRLALVSRARPPVNPSDTVISGTLFTPFVGTAMQTALDLCMVWSLYGLYMCKHFWPSPVTSPNELGPGSTIKWPRQSHPRALTPAGRERTPWVTSWARATFEQGILSVLPMLTGIGVYMAPNPADDCQLLPTIDEWVRSTSELEPVLVAGDFNKPPDASDRWTWLKGSGASLAVRNSEGQYEPTRWKGRRCIDWLWSSHPHMISQLDFVPVFFADHKAVTCQVKVDQQSVRTYRAVPTRRLLPPSDISPGAWKAACEAAWADVSIPPSSTTEQEWQWFCRVAEQAYDRAMTLCGVEPPTQRGTRPKGTDLQVTAIRPETFRLKQNASCHELKLRRLLGRVLEAMRLVEQDAPIPNILKKRIWHHPLVRNQGFHRIEDIQSWCHSELESFLRQEKIARLQKWRQHIRSDPKAAAKWVRREHHAPVTSVYEDTFEQGRPSSNNQKSLEAIRKFWEGIWHRQGPDLDRATQAWQQHMPAEPEQPWNDITPQELQIQAAQQRGKAPGPDGWSGDELSFWPAQAWIVFAALTNRWLNREETPNVWASVRQVHIQKPEAVLRSDGALHAKHLRPIAIQCILWRIIASSWTCRSDTRQWVQRWAHPSAQGGVAGRSVGQAIDILLQEFAKKDKVLVSLDYSKCFDHVDPKIGIRCLVHLGCPRQIAGPLSAIWLNQRRWLTYNGECLPEAQQVSSSLPQGDSLSPLTLIAIVSGLSAHIVHDEPEPHVLTTFLDDRNFIASSPAQAGRLFHNWKLLSDEVGLSEKPNKAKVLTRKQKWQQDLIDEGFSADQIVPSTRVLGVDATARLGAAIKPTHDLRVRQAQQRADRIALLPVTSQHKRGLLASMVVPKAVWGTWTRRPPASKLDTKIKRCSGCHQSASVDLWVLLTGHGLSVEFCSGFQAFSYLAKQIHRRPRQWQPRPRRGTWVHRVQKWLASLGWTSVAPWMWNHPRQNWNLNLQNPITERDAHEIRESWRWQRFQSFLNSSRRDATSVQGVVVDARRISLARKLFRQQNVHGCGVMMGGVISDARFDKIRSVNLGGCQWCSEETVPTWHHLAWECPELAATRCRLPQDPLQRVLGWPTGADKAYDEAVMVHLSTVRQRILDRRYRRM